MDKKKAKQILDTMYAMKAVSMLECGITPIFPIKDEVIYTENKGTEFIQYTFIGLIKIAYDL